MTAFVRRTLRLVRVGPRLAVPATLALYRLLREGLSSANTFSAVVPIWFPAKQCDESLLHGLQVLQEKALVIPPSTLSGSTTNSIYIHFNHSRDNRIGLPRSFDKTR